MDFLREIGLTFVPLFVAMDVVGLLPVMVGLTGDLTRGEIRRMSTMAMITAVVIGGIFVALGKAIFNLMGISVNDFLLGGGAILFLLSAKDLLTGKMVDVDSPSSDPGLMGVVPIGIPLIVGPGILTTLLLLVDQYNIWAVVISFLLNLVVAWLGVSNMDRIMKLLGASGTRGLSKVASLLLAAIAVKMIRQGILGG
jgi:multiple antibiotic resistance protein